MPLFTRRRLQVMLDDIVPRLVDEKARDLLRRLEGKSVDQALPAEMELALLWCLGSIGDIEIEPNWWAGKRRPDAYTESLVPGRACAIEIAATNDNSISAEAEMDRVALQISDCASRAEKGCGAYLFFRFREESGYRDSRYTRRVMAPRDYILSKAAAASVNEWVKCGQSRVGRLHIVEQGLDVEVERTLRKQNRYHNIWTSMPPETHSLDGNPLFSLLKRKADQLSGASKGVLRLIFIADAGSTLLHRLGTVSEIDHTRRRVSAREIIPHFLVRQRGRVDAIVVFSPRREKQLLGYSEEKLWRVTFFGTNALPDVPEALDRIAAMLPRPRFEGYQARSLFRQGAFAPTRHGWHLPITIERRMDEPLHVKFSARMLLDLLAGRMTPEQFRYHLGERDGATNLFKLWLDRGMTIKAASMAPRDIDQDDDHIIFDFDYDAAARSLNLPPSEDQGE